MTSFRKKGEWQNTRQVLKKVSETLLSHRSNFCSIEVIMMAKQLLLLNKKFNRIFWWSSLVSLRNNPIRCRCWQDHHLNWPTLKILQLLYWIFCKQKVVTSVHVTTLSHSSQTNSLNNRGGLVNFHCLAKRAVINISIEIESRDPWLESYFFALSPVSTTFLLPFRKLGSVNWISIESWPELLLLTSDRHHGLSCLSSNYCSMDKTDLHIFRWQGNEITLDFLT